MLFSWWGFLAPFIVGVMQCCDDLLDPDDQGATPTDSDLVIAGYTRAIFKTNNETKAEFLVFNTYKGDSFLPGLLGEREPSPLESALNRRLVNVSGFGCRTDVRVGETYILFLKVVNNVAFYDMNQLIVYSREKEAAALEYLGGLQSWGEWSACSKSCSGGIQVRRRNCSAGESEKKCPTEDGQRRSCNTLPCSGLFDVMKAVYSNDSKMNGVRDPVYRVSNNDSIRSASLRLPRAFPLEFSLLLTMRFKSSGFVLRTFASDKLLFGLHIGNSNVTLTLSEDVRLTFNLTSPWSPNWHLLSLLVRRKAATLFHNCKPLTSVSIAPKRMNLSTASLYVVVGALSNDSRDSFEGDIQQLVIAESPSSAAEQCSSNIQNLPKIQSSAVSEETRGTGTSGSYTEDQDYELNNGSEDDSFAEENGSGNLGPKQAIPLISEDDEFEHDQDDILKFYKNSQESQGVLDNVEGSGSAGLVHWSEWSPCSHSCGWGTRSRTAYCADNTVNSDTCGIASADRRETETCFIGLCTDETSTMTGNQLCPLDCQNGGSCISVSETCICPAGYFGKLCEHPLCSPSCVNRGACVLPNTCRCKPGYVGKRCQLAVCRDPCQNGGRCVGADRCLCSPGFQGSRCESPHCRPSCVNGGYCVKPDTCYCPLTATGSRCEQRICSPPCQNGGVCNAHGICKCSPGYTGPSCEQITCPEGCENGGYCSEEGRCVCSSGFIGARCEKRKCLFKATHEPYKKGFRKKVVTEAKVPCGAFHWKQCVKMKAHYVTAYKTAYRTTYRCVPINDPTTEGPEQFTKQS